MSEIKTIKCPNCGANTTNTQNCEYCGSLLVRFEDKGIDVSKTSYTNDAQTYPGIENALKTNLALQKSNPSEGVVTDIYSRGKDGLIHLLCVIRSGHAVFLDHTSIPSQADNGLCVIKGFHYYVDDPDDDFNRTVEKRHQKFKALDIFPLFMERISLDTDEDGEKRKNYEYFIDFGEDATGAARLISKVISEVYELPLDAPIECYTNVGDAIDKSRAKIKGKPVDKPMSGVAFYSIMIGGSMAIYVICRALLDFSSGLSWLVTAAAVAYFYFKK